MPATSGSAGSSTSSMKISGSLDTTNIDRGFARVKSGFESVKGHAKGFYSDLVRMGNEANKFSKNIIKAGMVGSSAIVALASKAPAVAPAMAKMGVAMTKLSINAGESLAPAFDMVSGWLDKFSTWVGNHPDIFSGLVITLTAMSVLKFTGLGGLLTTLGTAIVSPSVLTALGYIALIAGAAGIANAAITGVTNKLKEYAGMGTDPDAPTDMSGGTLSRRLPQKIWSDITGTDAPWEDALNPNSPAHVAAIEEIKRTSKERLQGYRDDLSSQASIGLAENRRAWFLQWWDSVWG